MARREGRMESVVSHSLNAVPDFIKTFRKKKIFLTGHTGFKGAWMSVWLSMLGAHVKGYALKAEKKSLYNQLSSGLKNHQSVIADIRNSSRLEKELLTFQPDYIFHLAAQPLVLESYKTPIETFDVNVIGTARLLDAVRKLKKPCVVVVVTTDKVYENIESDHAYIETDKLGGYDPYSASKAAAEIVTSSFRLSFFHPERYAEHKKSISTARAGNVIGGGDYAENRIVPDIFRALAASKPVPVRNPEAVRPWQHVLESLHGYLTLASSQNKQPVKLAESFNFGPRAGDTATVAELVNLAVGSWGKGNYKPVKQIQARHEAGLLRLDISKAGNLLAWKPKWDSSKAIDKAMSWYKKSLEKNCDVLALCEGDIREYMEDLDKVR